MKHFDLHCHPALKTFLGSDKEADRDNCWEEADVKGIWEVVDKLVGNILDSQSSLSQIENGNFGLIVAGLYSLEHPMIVGSIIGATNLQILSKHVNELSQPLLQKMVEKDPGFGYNDILEGLKKHLLDSKDEGSTYQLLNKINELDPNKLNIILAIEGGHALFNDLKNFTKDEILNNLDNFKTGPYRYLYLTLTHLATNPFCNQSYGMKLINDKHFLPVGYGITELGYEVINKALDQEIGNQIFIDIKHMSLKSRLQYYELIKDKNPKVPIIISHAGVSGVSYNEKPIYNYRIEGEHVKAYYVKPDGLQGTEFNPWSINLYDEEIPVIIKSGGLIGMIMEQRILGIGKVDPEYFSKAELDDNREIIHQNLNKYKNLYQIQKSKKHDDHAEKYFTSRYLRHLCNNILHIVKVGGKDAWKHICFGTDYDGMIHALRFSKSADKFVKVRRKLTRVLPQMAESDPDTNYYIENIESQVDDILYYNGIRFLDVNFK
ncbi:MAG: membrane dipeptidase [Mariniphaga sp.]|nr:membrane dipeptidase [Mariniphaga sp.]